MIQKKSYIKGYALATEDTINTNVKICTLTHRSSMELLLSRPLKCLFGLPVDFIPINRPVFSLPSAHLKYGTPAMLQLD